MSKKGREEQPQKTVKMLSKEEINILPLFCYQGKISVVASEEEVPSVLSTISRYHVVGVDTETKPSFKKGISFNPSLIQIATPEEVFLFPLKKISFSKPLIEFFENPAVIKTGVAIHDDVKALCRIIPFSPQSILDLSHMAKEKGISHMGLRGLAAYALGVRISKSEQCSNWGKADLSDKQVLYAATDAWVSLAIYQALEKLSRNEAYLT